MSEQHNLQGITIDPAHDIRLDAINDLSAVLASDDPYLSPFDKADIERVIGHLDAAILKENGLQMQTPILDFVRPVRGRSGP
jgi:hypothetical protein